MKNKLTEGPVGPHLVKLTLPMVWGLFALIGFNVADTYFVGQLGTAQLAAMSFTFPVVLTIGNLAFGIGIGASSVIARAIGKGDMRQVQRFTTNSLTLALTAVIIFVALGLLTLDPLFQALGADSETLPYIRDYMRIWYLGIVFMVVPMVSNSVIRAAGNTLVPSLMMTLGATLNVLLDPLLISGNLGFPRLELQGAALATVIAQGTTLVASLAVLRFKENLLSTQLPSLKETLWCWRDILVVGLPAAAASMITPISMGVITSFLASYGAAAVAGFGLASRVESLALIAAMALASSIGPFVGQNWGAQQFERVRQALRQGFRFCLIWGVIMAIGLGLGARSLAAIFNRDPDVIAIAAQYLWLVPISYGAAGLLQVASSAFNAMGKPIPSIVMTITHMVGCYIPLAYLGGRLAGPTGIFIAAAIANLVVGVGAYKWTQKTCQQSFKPIGESDD
ncbi:MATE family efflux transporter [Leptolyngbya cf. ectocarpi LEGE 11479]|uniref:MATE family efflux transporter n=1 Tax=Leptolyngbya cf. ectocarpi LEGE 11479 TaxID=1828722 RepID=A0A929F6H1_LEPEC|nr:MATE family efflux transporter [Leptolyngbya ectocarpi]MBE9068180.1 MATE family efflux transporter [Leptolyngbya cf. ectocarpi LEGE 11479]